MDKRCGKSEQKCEASARFTLAEMNELAEMLAEKLAAKISNRPRCASKGIAVGGISSTAKQEAAEDEEDALAVSYKEAGRLMGISERKIFDLCQTGELKAVSIGRARRVLRSSIEEMLAGN